MTSPLGSTAFVRVRRLAAQGLVIATLVGLWQVLSVAKIISSAAAPSFSSTMSALLSMAHTAGFWSSLWATIVLFAYGTVLTALIGVPLGVLVGSSRWIYRFLRPTIESIRPIPPIVIYPVAILTVGTGFNFSAVLILQGAMWPLLILTAYGVDVVPEVTLDTATIFRINWWRRILFVRLAQALPIVGSGLRIGSGIVFAVSIMAGYIAGAPGLGQQLGLASQANNLSDEFAVTVVIGLLGVVVIALFSALERRTQRWRFVAS